jgi:hypothetical protein
MVKFGATVGSSIIEMKIIIPMGSEPGQVQCENSEPESMARREGHYGPSVQESTSGSVYDRGDSEKEMSLQEGTHLQGTHVVPRQRTLQALVLVTSASIGILAPDPFIKVNNKPTTLPAKVKAPAPSNKTIGTTPQPAEVPSEVVKPAPTLSAYINAGSLTTVVISAVTAAVANTVAASAASSTASMSNAFQMIGHAQCGCSMHVSVSAFVLVRTCVCFFCLNQQTVYTSIFVYLFVYHVCSHTCIHWPFAT